MYDTFIERPLTQSRRRCMNMVEYDIFDKLTSHQEFNSQPGSIGGYK